MARVYVIRDWDKHFENSQSKRAQRTRWFPLSNKHDGRGFRRLLRLPDGVALYGAWVLILGVASKCPVRGRLEDDDGPLSAIDIADKTGGDESIIQAALEACASAGVGWLDVLPGSEQTASGSEQMPVHSEQTASRSECAHSYSEQNASRSECAQPELNRREGNRILSPSKPGERASPKSEIVEEIYQAYPRHVGKADARKAIAKALKLVDAEILLERVRAFAASPAGQAGDFTPYPATWFRKQQWDDDPAEWNRTNGQRNGHANGSAPKGRPLIVGSPEYEFYAEHGRLPE